MVATFLVALTLTAQLQSPATGVVRGQVYSETTAGPLQHAIVEVIGDGQVLAAVTDSTGSYLLRGVRPGRRLLRARHFDHAPFEVEVLVAPGGQVVLDLALELRPVSLPAVTARGTPRRIGGADTVPVARAELGATTVKTLEATPGVAELGLADGARGTPGREPIDPSDVLYVRGTATDLKLVLLDGAPVYSPFHLGGLINAFEPDLLSGAKLYLGGAPARYDGALSYVMDLSTRAGRREGVRTEGALDLISARALVEGPLDYASGYLVSGRVVHALGAEHVVDSPFPYAYADGLARLDVALPNDGAIALTGFWNRESVQLDSFPGVDRTAGWGNSAGSIRYRGPVGRSDTELTASYGQFQASLPVGGSNPAMADGLARRGRLAAHFSRSAGPVRWAYGGAYDHLWIRYSAVPRFALPEEVPDVDEAAGGVAGAYLDGAWQPLSRLSLRAGLRTDLFTVDPTPRLAPRLTATWLLTDRVAFTLAGGQYRQYVRTPERRTPRGDLIVLPDTTVGPPLAVASATHYVVALDQDFDEGFRLGLEGFYKRFQDLPDAESSAEASGVDVWVRRSTGRLTGWLGYSLAWVWTYEDGRPFAQMFAGRHLMSTGLTGPLGTNGRFDVRFAYGAGLPYTAVPETDLVTPAPLGDERPLLRAIPGTTDPPAPPSNTPEPYLRLDVEVAHTWTPRFRGSPVRVTPYVKVLNALDRRDALFYRFDSWSDTAPRALATLPVLPVVGLHWSF
jgi:hypothetical protein